MIYLKILTFLIFYNTYPSHTQVHKKIRHYKQSVLLNHVKQYPKDKIDDFFTVNSLLSLYDFDGDQDLFVTRKNVFWVVSIIIINSFIFGLIMYKSSRLFSKGFCKKFMNGGGWWIILSAFLGLVLGCLLGYFMNCSILVFGFSTMLMAVSGLLVGRRGMIVGAISGLELGVTLRSCFNGSISGMIAEGLLFSFAGCALGFVPIFPDIKINTRYIQKSLKYFSDSPNSNFQKHQLHRVSI